MIVLKHKLNHIKQAGFSLIELLVTIAIVGVLAAAGMFGYTRYILSAKIAVNNSNAKLLADALAAESVTTSTCIDTPINGSPILSTQISLSNLISCANKIKNINKFINPFSSAEYQTINPTAALCGSNDTFIPNVQNDYSSSPLTIGMPIYLGWDYNLYSGGWGGGCGAPGFSGSPIEACSDLDTSSGSFTSGLVLLQTGAVMGGPGNGSAAVAACDPSSNSISAIYSIAAH